LRALCTRKLSRKLVGFVFFCCARRVYRKLTFCFSVAERDIPKEETEKEEAEDDEDSEQPKKTKKKKKKKDESDDEDDEAKNESKEDEDPEVAEQKKLKAEAEAKARKDWELLSDEEKVQRKAHEALAALMKDIPLQLNQFVLCFDTLGQNRPFSSQDVS
jgi:hypothetical protein